jgi:fumarate hydratase, class II
MKNDLALKAAALGLGFVTEEKFDRVVNPAMMTLAYVAYVVTNHSGTTPARGVPG